jgi:hypothetical protein
MPNLATLDLPTALANTEKLLGIARALLAYIDKTSSLPFQQPMRHLTDYMIGELEKCGAAAVRLEIGRLASATRNLFELTFVTDYVCASDQNMDRFILDAAIDELEIREKFLAIDKTEANYVQDVTSMEKAQQLAKRVAEVGLTGARPLMPFDIAKAMNREAEYRALYQVYSKMSHASAWIMLGTCNWEKMALLLLVETNSHAGECAKSIAKKVGFAAAG